MRSEVLKAGPGTMSASITCSADARLLPRPLELETPGMGPSILNTLSSLRSGLKIKLQHKA